MNRKFFKKSNQGNTFIIVVATLSFLAVLTASLLTAVSVCYRMKAYDINSRDNFYYLDKAMDELYAGVGQIAMKDFNQAYNDVTELIVVYDTQKEAYVSMENDDANVLFTNLFVKELKSDNQLKQTEIENTLKGFLTSPYDSSSNPEGVELKFNGNVSFDDNSCTISNILLKRTASYSTLNNYKGSSAPEGVNYVQSITTDMVISIPDFQIDFSSLKNDPLFDFAMISDRGIEITGMTSDVVIDGDIYAASDFYNKYPDKNISTADTKDNNGVDEKSMYSGLYVDKAKVSIISDKLIVPGSIAAMNCSEVYVKGSGRTDKTELSQIWTDNIILGGYARDKETTNSNGVTTHAYSGAKLDMNANVYVSDDLELNASGSNYKLTGNYFGYNDARTDNRTFNKEYLKEVVGKSVDVNNVKFVNGNYIDKDGNTVNLPGQSHYNSSSVVVNGKDSELDLSDTDTMYIAGQAYIEMSKDTRPEKNAQEKNGNVDYSDTVEEYKFSFNDKDADNYSLDNKGNEKRIDDYKTGESLSVKSNQLAYIPPYKVDESQIANGNIYVEWPQVLLTTTFKYTDNAGNIQEKTFNDIFNSNKVPVIKTVVGGENYYFYDFSQVDENIYKAFIENYANLFLAPQNGGRSVGDLADLYDITNWDSFKVKSIVVDDSKNKIYTNSAISVKNAADTNLTIKGRKDDIEPLVKVDNDLNLKKDYKTNNFTAANAAINASDEIRNDYKKIKNYLKLSLSADETTELAKEEKKEYDTPIVSYFNFTDALGEISEKLPKSGYYIISSDSDLTIDGIGNNGVAMGVILCRGNVTFANNIKEFHGLIVSSGKIKIDHDINIVANHEIVKAVIDECKKTEKDDFLKIFKDDYGAKAANKPDKDIVPLKDVSSLQYEDILGYDNFNKNVD